MPPPNYVRSPQCVKNHANTFPHNLPYENANDDSAESSRIRVRLGQMTMAAPLARGYTQTVCTVEGELS